MTASSPETSTIPKYFHSLDVLRGLAALTIVFWHWQHFFYDGTKLLNFDVTEQPLYSLFKPLYLQGRRAVDLFFTLSGFIFFWLYEQDISSRKLPPKTFFILRFSRLHPLHVLTLVIVLAGQMLMLSSYGAFFVYPHNDLFHFALQTIFASNWGFEQGYSFNAPIWSVSVEVLCYAIFFVVCFLRLKSWWFLGLMVCVGFLISRAGLEPVGGGISSFFVGGLSFKLFLEVMRRGISKKAVITIAVFTGLMWALIPVAVYDDWLFHAYKSHLWAGKFMVLGKDVIGTLILLFSRFAFDVILFPATIMALSLWETHYGTLGRRLAFLGHISYSSYLLHFPLQLFIVWAFRHFSMPRDFFYSPASLALFFALLIPLSLYTHHYFERPCQSFIRRRLLQERHGED